MNHSNVKLTVPFFMVTNMVKSLDFYVERLGFTIRDKWEPSGTIEWCRLELDDATIMLQEYRLTPPVEKLGEGLSVYFICEDALTIYRDIVSRGVKPDEPFVGNRMWVVGMKDPDGYNILFESATDVPEETLYSDWKRSANIN